jgi:hypothetical protein
MNGDGSHDRPQRRKRRVARRPIPTQSEGVDRAEALEEATRQYISEGYEMMDFTDYTVRLRVPRRMRWLRALILCPIAFVAVWVVTGGLVLAYGAIAIAFLADVVWNTAMKPQNIIMLGVDEDGQVKEIGI